MGSHQSGLYSTHYQAISPFDLTVGLWVIYRGVVELNAQLSTPVFHLISCEVGAVISNDAVRDTVTVHNA